jgi:hypothetical protein
VERPVVTAAPSWIADTSAEPDASAKPDSVANPHPDADTDAGPDFDADARWRCGCRAADTPRVAPGNRHDLGPGNVN